MTDNTILSQYAPVRAERLEQVRYKLAHFDALILEIEKEAHMVYNAALGTDGDTGGHSEEWFARTDTEYANMAADLRSAKEANRVLFAHMTSALVRGNTLHLFNTGDKNDES